MLKLIKRIAALTGTVCCVLLMLLTPVYAGEQYTEGDLIYEIEDNGIIITGYFGNEQTVVIPNQIAGIPVFKIAASAFVKTTVKELVLPDTIMTIENQAIASDIKVTYQKENSGPDAQPAEQPATEEEAAAESENGDIPIEIINDEDASEELSGGDGAEMDLDVLQEEEDSSQSAINHSGSSGKTEQNESTGSAENKAGLIGGALICLIAAAGIIFFARRKR